jgi:hypothetical protein
MRAQVGEDYAMARTELIDDGVPEMVIQREGMQQNHIRTCSCDLVEELGIATAECRHTE